MSRSGTRDTDIVAWNKVPAFLVLAGRLKDIYGVREVERRTNVSWSTISNIRAGYANMSLTTARRIAAAWREHKGALA